MLSLIILIISCILQLFAALWSLRLIKPAKKHLSLILLIAGFALMTASSITQIAQWFQVTVAEQSTLPVEWSGLFISLLMAAGIYKLEEIFSAFQNEEKIRIESENKFKTLFNSSSDEIYLIDTSGNFIEVNQVICDALGYSPDELRQMHIRQIKSPRYTERIPALLEKVIKDGSLTFVAEHIAKNGKVIPVEIKSRIIQYENRQAILSIARDITERKQTERKILNAIIETEEKEKERFAKDLHDGLGTVLSSINLYLNIVQEKQMDAEESNNLLNVTKGLVDEAIQSSKEIANNLRPNIISRFGFVASIQNLCDKINNTGVITIHFNHGNLESDESGKDIDVTLYRIINELINNTLKHASANKIDITLNIENNLLILIYSDDGIGFNVQEAMEPGTHKGMGLSNLISRVKAINGNYIIDSSAEKGTKVVLKVRL